MRVAERTGTKNGKALFAISGRNGVWKYVDGRRRPNSDGTSSRYRCVAVARTQNGRRLVREFIRVRKWKRNDDSLFVDRLRSGSLRVDPATGRVFTRLGPGGRNTDWSELKQEPDAKGYLFVRVYQGESRKAIAVHRLVVMADIDGEIPEGFDVDHRDNDVTNNAISNLRLRSIEVNRATAIPDGENGGGDEVPF